MILQSLIQYYRQNTNSNNSDLAPIGFEYKEIPFIILLNAKGDFITIQDTRKKSQDGERYLVPRAVKRSGIGCHPNYLWDNSKYVFGVGSIINPKQKNSLDKKRMSFLKHLKETIPDLKKNKEIQAVICFLESDFLSSLKNHPLWEELVDLNANLSFSIEHTNRLVSEQNSVIEAFSVFFQSLEDKTATCLATGKVAPIARLHPLIQGVYGAQGSGASLISYNMPCAQSFNKEQGYNAPISQDAAFAYGTALNHLLQSPQKISFDQIMTVIFWAEKKSSFESVFSDFLRLPSKGTASLSLPRFSEDDEDLTPFFIQIISPQGARLSIRSFWTGTIGKLKKNILSHFKNLHLEHSSGGLELFSIYSLLQALSPCSDVKHIQGALAGSFLSNILNELPYPKNLLPILIEKLSNKEGISHRKISLIKACLNQNSENQAPERPAPKIQAILDLSNQNIGYLLGRLFALLELARKKLRQKKEAPSVHNFYKMASISPKNTFPLLLKRYSLYEPFLTPNDFDYLNKTKDSLLQAITEIPSQLSLVNQGNFALGYYQQKHNFFSETKRKPLAIDY